MGSSFCYICKKDYQNNGMTRHLKSCLIKNAGYNADANNADTGFLIHVTARYNNAYSLYMMVDGCVRFEELDCYLRDIWLDCCDHLSHFEIEGEYFESCTVSIHEQSMEDEVGDLFYPGLTFTYEYDFGSTTYLTLSVKGAFESAGKERGIRLLARNRPVEYTCERCEKTANFHYINPYDGECGMVCSACKRKMEQENDEIDFSKWVNSPRVGVCAYEGPADDILFMRHTPLKHKKKSKKSRNTGKMDPYDMLEVMEGIMTGHMSVENPKANQILEQIFDRWMNNKKNDEPFVITEHKVSEKTLLHCLIQLRKYELDIIRKQLDIRVTSKIKKKELAECIENHIRQNFREILEHMPYDDFRILREISREEIYSIDLEDEASLRIMQGLLRKGFIFAIRHPLEKIELFFPLRTDFLQFTADSKFIRKREYTKQIEEYIDSIFFYWGVADLHKVMKETAHLLKVPVDETFAFDFYRIISLIDTRKIKYELIGNTRYYYMYSDFPAEQIISNTWQKSIYPAITPDMIPKESGMIGLIMHHLHLRLLFELFYDLFEEKGIDELDGDQNESAKELFREKALYSMSILLEILLNAKPEISTEQLFKETDLPEYFWKQKVFRTFFNDLKNHVPNYWMKGNTISGNMYFTDENFDKFSYALTIQE